MRARYLVPLVLLAMSSPSASQTPRDCQALWKEADINGNGTLTREEDVRGYIDAMQLRNALSPGAVEVSQDEFMLYCSGSVERSGAGTPQQKGGAGHVDRGKGDMTPGLIPFPKNEARRRLEASGFRDVGELKLDENGIWRSQANSGGKRVSVAVDVQGEILAGN